MKNLLIAAALTASVGATASTIYFDDGSTLDLPVGSKVYVTKRTVWEFTRFNEGGFDIRPLLPVVEVEESCTASDGLTFGGSSYVCEEVLTVTEEEEVVEVEVEVEDEACDVLTFGGGC